MLERESVREREREREKERNVMWYRERIKRYMDGDRLVGFH